MKILDPQSATLTLPEVQTFLLSSRNNPNKTPTSTSSTAPTTAATTTTTTTTTTTSRPNPPALHNHRTVLNDISAYLTFLSPHTKDLPPPDTGPNGGWLREVVRVLGAKKEDGGFTLTKGECVGVVNLGVGMGVAKTTEEEQGGSGGEVEEDGGDEGEEGVNSDLQVLHAVVEELETRLSEDEVDRLLSRVRQIMAEARREWVGEGKDSVDN